MEHARHVLGFGAVLKPLNDKRMRELGFTDRNPEKWYLCRTVGSGSSTTLNLTLHKQTGEWEELVMNEDFGQPEYYGQMNPKYGDEIRRDVDKIVAEMSAAGLPFSVDHREYGAQTL